MKVLNAEHTHTNWYAQQFWISFIDNNLMNFASRHLDLPVHDYMFLTIT